jgi:hypothetical protein
MRSAEHSSRRAGLFRSSRDCVPRALTLRAEWLESRRLLRVAALDNGASESPDSVGPSAGVRLISFDGFDVGKGGPMAKLTTCLATAFGEYQTHAAANSDRPFAPSAPDLVCRTHLPRYRPP